MYPRLFSRRRWSPSISVPLYRFGYVEARRCYRVMIEYNISNINSKALVRMTSTHATLWRLLQIHAVNQTEPWVWWSATSVIASCVCVSVYALKGKRLELSVYQRQPRFRCIVHGSRSLCQENEVKRSKVKVTQLWNSSRSNVVSEVCCCCCRRGTARRI